MSRRESEEQYLYQYKGTVIRSGLSIKDTKLNRNTGPKMSAGQPAGPQCL